MKRTYLVYFKADNFDPETREVELLPDEKANTDTFRKKIEEALAHFLVYYDRLDIYSWSLIEASK